MRNSKVLQKIRSGDCARLATIFPFSFATVPTVDLMPYGSTWNTEPWTSAKCRAS